MSGPITTIVVGCGNRGRVYSAYALENPTKMKVVAIAEPRPWFKQDMATRFQLQPNQIYSDWKDIAALPKFADAVIITTPDRVHLEPALAFANKGYHLLLEKPMAVSEEDCISIAKAVHKNNVILGVGHVLRYTPYTQKIKELIPQLGELLNVNHIEPVGWYHFAHSYVRGNWHKEADSSFSLLAKSCHDIDWLSYMVGSPCVRLSSFGSLKHFQRKNKPIEAGNADRCLDCAIQHTCPYSSTIIYLDRIKSGHTGWPVNIITNREPDIESVLESLKTTNYGKCAYEMDNDVCDNQVVNLQFANGVTATFTMIATSKDICVRKTRMYGSFGQLECDGQKIEHFDFRTQKTTSYTPAASVPPGTKLGGHAGADWHLANSWVEAILTKDPSKIKSGPLQTLESHLLVFAAERSRLKGTIEDTTYVQRILSNND